ncbi:MAG: radical SAM protein [Candidatus Coatesbacteria bacterium]|nr:MAG: radical SAM protein [Candidatus Coatesbacteria bacterium]
MSIKRWFRSIFEKPKPLGREILSKRIDNEEGNWRLHLRIEPNGEGVLIINASRVIHLNQTGAEIAKYIIEEKSPKDIIGIMTKRYRVSSDRVKKDIDRITDLIEVMLKTDEICPITYLDVDRISPFTTPVSAPYRMDLALTYRCQNNCEHCYVGRPKDMEELDTDKWKDIITRLWEIGIPHLVFTGGEATLRDDLIELVEWAENTGLVTGLNTNGRRLSDRELVRGLTDAGLDHVQITIESHDKKIHDEMVGSEGAFDETVRGIKNAVEVPLYLVTNTTLTRMNTKNIKDTVKFVADLGVEVFACNGIIRSGEGKHYPYALTEMELKKILERIINTANNLGLRLIWYTPTMYCKLNPIEMGLGVKSCTAGLYNMAIEPDGKVLPCQSYYKDVGNILKDEWESIWNNELLNKIRSREYMPDMCSECEWREICGAGCPLSLIEGDETVFCFESGSNAPV